MLRRSQIRVNYHGMQIPQNTPVFTVSELNREAREALEASLPPVWVEGEISNLARPGSGHMYFSLKDAKAQIRCAMFRGANRGLGFSPADGLQVLVNGRVTVYETRGTYQLIIEHMEPAGEGLLRRKLEELKNRLAAEGLFAPAHKQDLPAVPRRIGIITSPTGAAVRDILNILGRRFPACPVVIYPVQVQGNQAKNDIVAALTTAAARNECDVLILGRGGGSLEDLWSFNEEIVVRAIFACPIPLISAVGHEVDFTLSDLVADLRAPTPSGAAELVAPDMAAVISSLHNLEMRSVRAVQRVTHQRRVNYDNLAGRLSRCHPGVILRQLAQRLDETHQRLLGSGKRRLTMEGLRLQNACARLKSAAPLMQVQLETRQLDRLRLKLFNAVRMDLSTARNRLAVTAARMQAVSPLGTLERGYAIVQDENKTVIRDASKLKPEQRIIGRLARGRFEAVVKKIRSD